MYSYQYPHPAVTVDTVIFSLRDAQLQVLLVRRGNEPFKGMWAIPGGFVDVDEDLDSAARRELEEETGVSGVFLEQLYSFGEPGRDPRERVISVAYYALVPSDRLQLRAASDALEADWFSLHRLPELAFDHGDILAMAHQRLADKLGYSSLAFQFLGDTFTLNELQQVYQVILRREMDKRNFRKWILARNLIEETGETRREGAHRPARLYRLRHPGAVEIIR